MKDIIEMYEDKYGHKLNIVLRSLGGDPYGIETYWQDRANNPDPTTALLRTMIPSMTVNSDTPPEVDQIHFQIIREIERLYFAGTPRDVAVKISNALLRSDVGQFAIVAGEPELSYNVDTFYKVWNKHNPEQPPIIAPPIDIG